jgi:hypothetical protein
MRSRRAHAHVMSWLGVVAVLGNLLGSVLCVTTAKVAAPVDDILGPLVLCTTHGPQTLPGSEGPVAPVPGTSGQDQGDGRSSHCTACTLLAGIALLTAFIFAAIAFPVRIFYARKSSARTLADHLSLGGIRSRAPPLSA